VSWQPGQDPILGNTLSCNAIEHVIVPRARDIGAFEVRRALPSAQKQMVGPFIFFDQMGPAEFRIGHGVDVRPHPHIGLATVTYLFEGEVWHRDSLSTSAPIRPGEVNLMSAGRGIVHSERETSAANLVTEGQGLAHAIGETGGGAKARLFGIQAWAALPKSHEEQAPAFAHHGAGELPGIDGEGKRARVVIGRAYGATSPVAFPHAAFYVDAALEPGATLPLDADYEERAVYVAAGAIDVAGDIFGQGRLLVFRPGDRISIRATTAPARLILLGGAPMDGPRHIWWNFVASSKERIDAAKEDWRSGRFALVPGDEKEIIPLPG
jgi:redox-sensitive bicupin YhaK (pirin superfamily)